MNSAMLNKSTVVTGGASGIGEAIVRLYHAEGARVVIADTQRDRGAALAAELGPNTRFVETDVTSEAALEAAIGIAVAEFGRLDCMVNNAGFVGAVGSIAEISAEAWRQSLAVLLDGVVFGVKHAARVMLRQGQGGAILNTASVAGLRGGFGAHPYSVAKHAVIGLTRSAAAELASHGIRVNAVAPGGVISPLSLNLINNDAELATRLLAESSPMRQATFPSDIAPAFLYLASDAARLVTGQVIVVDAGVTMAPENPAFHTGDAGFIGAPRTATGSTA